jgi:hypothetical protein
LKDPRNFLLASPFVSFNATLPMPFIFSGNDLNAISKLLLEALQDLKAFVSGTIINAKKNKAFSPVFNFMKPFGDHFPDGSLFVVYRHDDGEFGRVHGLGLWPWQKQF